MLKEILAQRDYLPILKMNDGSEVTRENWEERKKELRALLEKYSYGHTPDVEVKVKGELVNEGFYHCAGKCKEEKIQLTYETKFGKGTFPIQIYTPTKIENPPVFLNISFALAPHRYIPVEEIIDGGYALVVVDYRDMVNDAHFGDFTGGIAEHFGTTMDRGEEEWGKIGMWAWGASRVLDYLIENCPALDTKRVVVAGHSRLGKTALWCAALDERFIGAISNNSGYGGAASSKHGTGERVTSFMKSGSWDWYCENFKKYSGELEDCKPYDQSFMTALIAPRLVMVGSAKEDTPADPTSEFLTTLHASSAWELLGEKGLVPEEDRMPETGDFWGEGNILYHYREGRHYFSREDWNAYMKFLDSKIK